MVWDARTRLLNPLSSIAGRNPQRCSRHGDWWRLSHGSTSARALRGVIDSGTIARLHPRPFPPIVGLRPGPNPNISFLIPRSSTPADPSLSADFVPSHRTLSQCIMKRARLDSSQVTPPSIFGDPQPKISRKIRACRWSTFCAPLFQVPFYPSHGFCCFAHHMFPSGGGSGPTRRVTILC